MCRAGIMNGLLNPGEEKHAKHTLSQLACLSALSVRTSEKEEENFTASRQTGRLLLLLLLPSASPSLLSLPPALDTEALAGVSKTIGGSSFAGIRRSLPLSLPSVCSDGASIIRAAEDSFTSLRPRPLCYISIFLDCCSVGSAAVFVTRVGIMYKIRKTIEVKEEKKRCEGLGAAGSLRFES